MDKKGKLTSEEKKFFILLNKAITSNPFDEERDKVLDQISNGRRKNKNDQEYILSDIFPELNQKINDLERRGLKRIQDLSRENRQLVEPAYLYSVYHRYIPDFDKHRRVICRKSSKARGISWFFT